MLNDFRGGMYVAKITFCFASVPPSAARAAKQQDPGFEILISNPGSARPPCRKKAVKPFSDSLKRRALCGALLLFKDAFRRWPCHQSRGWASFFYGTFDLSSAGLFYLSPLDTGLIESPAGVYGYYVLRGLIYFKIYGIINC